MRVVNVAALVAAVVVAHWLHKRIERVEQASGAWRVQPADAPVPWAEEAWWASDRFDRALAEWSRMFPEDGAA